MTSMLNLNGDALSSYSSVLCEIPSVLLYEVYYCIIECFDSTYTVFSMYVRVLYGVLYFGHPKADCRMMLFAVFKKNLNASKPSEHSPQVKECLKV